MIAVGLAALPVDLPLLGGPGTLSEFSARSPVLLLAAQRQPVDAGPTFAPAQTVAIVRTRSKQPHRGHSAFDPRRVIGAIFRSARSRALLERAGIRPGASVVVARGTAPWEPPEPEHSNAEASSRVTLFSSGGRQPLTVDVTLGVVNAPVSGTPKPSTPKPGAEPAPPAAATTTTEPRSEPSSTTTTTTTTEPRSEPSTTTTTTTSTTTTTTTTTTTGPRPAKPGTPTDVTVTPTPGSPGGGTPIGIRIDDSRCLEASVDTTITDCPGRPGPTTTTTTTTTTPTTTVPSAPDATALGASFGLANGYPLGDPAAFGRELDSTRATGAHWYRGDVVSAGMADYIVPMVRARGLEFLAILGGSGRTLDAATAAAVVAKYGPSHEGGIDAVEILNEPDLRMSAASYLAVVNAVVPAIRAADPDMPIVVGAVSNAAPGNPFAWFNALYGANGGQPLPGDAVSYHDYLAWPNALQKIYAIMQAHGDGGKKLWNSETGRSTADVSIAQQASDVARIVRDAETLPFLGVTFLYQIRDVRTGDGVQYDNYGLYDSAWRPKPSLAAFVSALAGP